MPKQKSEEERVFLLANAEELSGVSCRNFYPSALETAIAKGASNHVGKWPSHLYAAFLAASLIFAALILFAVVTALFCIPITNYRCRKSAVMNFMQSPNVFFIKHNNRTWTSKELCNVEFSIRDNRETNVYLINLFSNDNEISELKLEDENHNVDPRMIIDTLVFLEKMNEFPDPSNSPNMTEEQKIRRKLEDNYSNVKNIDIKIDDFFKGSMLADVAKNLDEKTLEIAAKANILWNTAGIALDPMDFYHIRHSKDFLCKRGCNFIKSAAINPRGSFQASGVPCQAFLGYLLRQISKNGVFTSEDVIRKARDNFCQRLKVCEAVELYNDSHNNTESSDCPTINPTKIDAIE